METTSTSTPEAPAGPPETLDHDLKVLWRAGWVIVGLGLLVCGFILHQLFVTTWLARAHQAELTESAQARFASVTIERVPYPVSPLDVEPQASEPAPRTPSLLIEPAPAPSEPFAIIRIPSLERLADGWTVVEGVGRGDLKTGAGHMPDTPLPGMPGNAVISGHRTTYGAPFNELDELVPGDTIEIETAVGVHVYAVRETLIVSPVDVWVTEPRTGAWLTLTTCHPEFSARQRLVVVAELVDGPNWEAIYG